MSRLILLALFATSFLGGLALQNVDVGTIPWAVSRASGLAAFVVLTASMVMGLLISTKASDGVLSRPLVFDLHQFLSVTSLALVGLHAGSLLFDGFFQFTPLSLVIPFVSPYRPLAVGAGVVAGWLMAITTGSFWLRSRIGVRRWRTLHYLTFLTYLAALGHGMFAGTDSQLPGVYWAYIVSVGLVLSLTTLRISGYRSRSSTARLRRGLGGRAGQPA